MADEHCRDRPKFGFGRNHPKNVVSAWFRLRQKGTGELWFRPKLDHVQTETGHNWISSVSCSDLQSDDVIFQKQWAELTAWSESSHVHSASPPQLENRKCLFSL